MTDLTATLEAFDRLVRDRVEFRKAGDDLLAALEARDRRIADLEAGLRRIANSIPLTPHESAQPAFRKIDRIARQALDGER